MVRQSPTATAMPRVSPRATGRPRTLATGNLTLGFPRGCVTRVFFTAGRVFAARRRGAPREVGSSAIRWCGPQKTELPKLHSARTPQWVAPPRQRRALRRVISRQGLSRGRCRGWEPRSRRRSAVRRRARCVPAPFCGVDPRKPLVAGYTDG
jgi:hypothetical protein